MVRPVMIAVVVGMLASAAMAEEDVLAEAMGRNPERFADMVIDLIAGFGGPEGLQPDGIEAHIALERAGARASALRRFLAMDLDADGTVDRGELAISQRAANASVRGRMERQFAAADANGDGRADAGEMVATGQAAALRALGEDEAKVLRALMTLDADRDGALSVAEVDAAVARLEAPT
ncbi:EF-hand domain-containing protein [Tabrizicola sp.]|uniref:EF-hand domain-containing protein n=1 Tax=Tabrizicola sp. TaxID=2005166 RepID=UPI003F2B8296